MGLIPTVINSCMTTCAPDTSAIGVPRLHTTKIKVTFVTHAYTTGTFHKAYLSLNTMDQNVCGKSPLNYTVNSN